jgi:hypothetical protein
VTSPSIPDRAFFTLTEVVTLFLDGRAMSDNELAKCWHERDNELFRERGYESDSLADLCADLEWLKDKCAGPTEWPDTAEKRKQRAERWLTMFGEDNLDAALERVRGWLGENEINAARQHELYLKIGQLAEGGKIEIVGIEITHANKVKGVHSPIPATFFHRPFRHDLGDEHGTINPIPSANPIIPLTLIMDTDGDLRSSYRDLRI